MTRREQELTRALRELAIFVPHECLMRNHQCPRCQAEKVLEGKTHG